MKTFEEFKKEVQQVVDAYNAEGHWVDAKEGGLRISISPVFADYSSDGYMPKYYAGFNVMWGEEHKFKSGRYVTYVLRFGKPYVSGVKGSPVRNSYKTLRSAFQKIF